MPQAASEIFALDSWGDWLFFEKSKPELATEVAKWPCLKTVFFHRFLYINAIFIHFLCRKLLVVITEGATDSRLDPSPPGSTKKLQNA
jgi:hypothetical protein